MKLEFLPLSKIKENEANPRTITKDKFARLVNSLISFPTMLAIRPIVVDDSLTILGGNMRYRALVHISQMQFEEIKKRIQGDKVKEAHWQRFFDKPTVPVLKASDLTDEEKQRFIIEDNVPFGEWDWDKLANEWNSEDLEEWGLDVWQPEEENGDKKKPKACEDLSNDIKECFKIEIDCGNEEIQQELFNELEERGLKCRLLTL
ncbi:MAG: hypothetical protein HDT28_04980 [Clostridiales bacterium]|nr:hypothetical protein [Clostridiales bacterium]